MDKKTIEDVVILGKSILLAAVTFIVIFIATSFVGCSTREATFKCSAECNTNKVECSYDSEHLSTDFQ